MSLFDKISGWRFRSVSKFSTGSQIVRANNKIADTLFLSDKEKSGCQFFLLTSANHKEGKTTTAINLALTLAKRNPKRVLLVDANLRNPSINKLLKIDMSPGLYELVEKDSVLKGALREISDLYVITTGVQKQKNITPIELFSSQGMRELLKEIRANFDIVIIDSPCIKAYRDSLYLSSSIADKVILVVEANKTPKRSILMASQKIEKNNGNFHGIILNKQVNFVPFFIQYILQ